MPRDNESCPVARRSRPGWLPSWQYSTASAPAPFALRVSLPEGFATFFPCGVQLAAPQHCQRSWEGTPFAEVQGGGKPLERAFLINCTLKGSIAWSRVLGHELSGVLQCGAGSSMLRAAGTPSLCCLLLLKPHTAPGGLQGPTPPGGHRSIGASRTAPGTSSLRAWSSPAPAPRRQYCRPTGFLCPFH